MTEFSRSDLASECGCTQDGQGIRVSRKKAVGYEIMQVQIRSEEAAQRIGKPCGRYVTLDCGDIHMLDDMEFEKVRCALSVEIREMAERMTGKRVRSDFSVLVAGLGNQEITSDAVGPETVSKLSVTRHLHQYDGALFSTVGLCEISAFSPGVLGQTGMEAVELVKGAVRSAKPDLVVAVDALAARSVDRLAATVQLSDTGIHPGSGIGNSRHALNEKTVGTPVLALGVPTVVESATLIFDALHQAGISDGVEELRAILRNRKTFFVSPKEVDLLIPAIGSLLSGALEKAFTPREAEL